MTAAAGKTAAPSGKSASRSQATPSSEAPAVVTPPRLLEPRRALFALLLLVWAAWIGVLLWMYFTDVKPSPLQPHPATLRAFAQR